MEHTRPSGSETEAGSEAPKVASKPLATNLLEELVTAHENLRIHQEELRSQNEDLVQAKGALEESHAKLRDLFDYAPIGYCTLDQSGLVTDANMTASAMLGRARSALVGRPMSNCLISESRHAFRNHLRRAFAGERQVNVELEALRTDGSTFPMEAHSRVFDVGVPPKPQCRTVLTDIFRRRQAEEEARQIRASLEQRVVERTAELREMNENLELEIAERLHREDELRLSAKVFDNAAEAIMITDASASILAVNPAFSEITGYAADEAVGQNPRLLQSGRHDRAFYDEMWLALSDSGLWQGEIWNRRKDGRVYAGWLNISAARTADGTVTHYVALLQDISHRKESEERLEHLAHHDALTELPNRALFDDRLRCALERGHRNEEQVALLFLDLDRFKYVNDTFGHSLGDQLLRVVSRRLSSCARGVDTVARTGGDEFTILLEGAGREDAEAISQRILHELARPMVIQGRETFTGGSIGISVFPDDATDASELLKHADTAMYCAKAAGGNVHRCYTEAMSSAASGRMSTEAALRRALHKDEFVLHYQPQFDLTSGELVAAEALVRWKQDGELLLPSQFIGVAEECGLIGALGEWVIREAVRQARAWTGLRGSPLRMAVNLSGRQFRDGSLSHTVSEVLRDDALNPLLLEFEITETVLMANALATTETMEELITMGVQFAVDDFGTGVSSLAYLKLFPVGRLKIAQPFVQNLPTDSKDRGITNAIIAMGHSLGLRVIAEGVETEDQLTYLRSNSCDEIQGNIFSPALPPDEFADLLCSKRPQRL